MDEFRDDVDFDVDHLFGQMEEDDEMEDETAAEETREFPASSRMRQMARNVMPSRIRHQAEDGDAGEDAVSVGNKKQELRDLKEAVHQLFLSVCALYEVVREYEGRVPDIGVSEAGSEAGGDGVPPRESPTPKMPWWAVANLVATGVVFLFVLLGLLI
jgi:hypothetical protein